MADVYGGQELPDLPELPAVQQWRMYGESGVVLAVFTGHLANLIEGYRVALGEADAIRNGRPSPRRAIAVRVFDASSLTPPDPDDAEEA